MEEKEFWRNLEIVNRVDERNVMIKIECCVPSLPMKTGNSDTHAVGGG